MIWRHKKDNQHYQQIEEDSDRIDIPKEITKHLKMGKIVGMDGLEPNMLKEKREKNKLNRSRKFEPSRVKT